MQKGSKSGQFRSDKTPKAAKTSPRPSVDSLDDTPTVRQRLAEARRSGILDLRHLGLTSVPDDALKMPHLTTLLLGGNKITQVPTSFPLLFPELTYLDLSNNPSLSNLPSQELAALKNLVVLDVEHLDPNAVKKWISSALSAVRDRIAVFTGPGSEEDAEDVMGVEGGSSSAEEDTDHEDDDDREESSPAHSPSGDEKEQDNEDEQEASHSRRKRRSEPVRHRRPSASDSMLGIEKKPMQSAADEIAALRFSRRLDALEPHDVAQELRELYFTRQDPELVKYVKKRYGPDLSVVEAKLDHKARAQKKGLVEANRKFKEKNVKQRVSQGRREKSLAASPGL